MKQLYRKTVAIPQKIKTALLILVSVLMLTNVATVAAYTPPPPVNPQNSVVGLTGTIPSPPPTASATITVPSHNQVFTSLPYTVQGICQSGLLIKLFINNVFAGADYCVNGSYKITAALFNGTNVLVVRDYDALDQQGPDSNSVTVIFNNPNAGAGQGVTLTSNYAKLGVAPGSTLNWPVAVTGGNPSYALTVTWGDGKPIDLLSKATPGIITLPHIYGASGVYTILVKATDASGNIAYLQLVGVATGPASQTNASTTLNTPASPVSKGIKITNGTLFIIIGIVILIPAFTFWLGSRHRLINIKKRFEDGEGL